MGFCPTVSKDKIFPVKKHFDYLEETSLLIISSSPGLIILLVTQQSHYMDPQIMLLPV